MRPQYANYIFESVDVIIVFSKLVGWVGEGARERIDSEVSWRGRKGLVGELVRGKILR